MDRRRFLLTSLAGALATPLAVGAQQAGKVYRIGILGLNAADPEEARQWQAFRLGLRESGWIEGGNILIESRWAEGNLARIPERASDLVGLKVDLIVTRGSPFTQGARKATSSIPIVFTMHADPVRSGHVVSLAKPGGNITGLALQMTELYLKGLELLIAAVPGVKRIAVLWNPDAPSHPPGLKVVEEAARPLQLQLQPVWRGPGQILRAPSRPWFACTRRPFMCSAPGPTKPRDTDLPNWRSGTGCRRSSGRGNTWMRVA